MLRVEGISKRFGSYTAIEDISFTAAAGSVFGLVGYNGAGKTTLLKTIAGIYRPTAGRVLIAGQAVLAQRSHLNELFIVADEPYFAPQATPLAMQDFYRGFYGSWRSDVFTALLEVFGLDGAARIEGFSKGMARQVGIALGLASGARVLLLDESFDGLDLSKRNIIKQLLRLYAQKRAAVVLITSHNLTEVEDLADDLGMIDGCHLVFAGSLEAVRQEYPNASLEEIFLAHNTSREWDLDAIMA